MNTLALFYNNGFLPLAKESLELSNTTTNNKIQASEEHVIAFSFIFPSFPSQQHFLIEEKRILQVY